MASASELLQDLHPFAPEDAQAAFSLERLRRLLQEREDPFSRDWTEHVTASAVVARPAGDAFLLVHHRRLDRWLQPGGHVEPEDDSVAGAAIREAREETGVWGLDAPFGPRILDVDVHTIPARKKRPPHIHHDVRYLLTTSEERLAPSATEVRGAAWFSLEEALAADTDGSLTRAVTKARAWLTVS